MSLRRRDFFKVAGMGSVAALGGPSFLFPSEGPKNLRNLQSLLETDYPFPYDSEYFQAAERFVFVNEQKAFISILPKEGESLEIRLYGSENKMHLCNSLVSSYVGVNDSFDIPVIGNFWGPYFHYCIEYRSTRDKGKWKATPERTVKTPRVNLRDGKMEVILIGDDHTPDDADMVRRIVEDDFLREQRLSGDYVNLFLKELIKNPEYRPLAETDLSKMMNGYCLARTIRHIMANERPDFIMMMGDHRGGFFHKWRGLGLKGQNEATDFERDQYVKIFRLGTRKIFSALTPEIPIYWVLGNHDGESGYNVTIESATKYRKKYFKLPGLSTGGSPDENYYPIIWGSEGFSQGGALFVVLDCQRYNKNFQPSVPEDWTLGERQREWLKNILKHEADWKFVFKHHVLGGWDRGTHEQILSMAYGRGPLYTYEDYDKYSKNPHLVEQVELTKIFEEDSVNIIFRGHDHIFNISEIGTRRQGAIEFSNHLVEGEGCRRFQRKMKKRPNPTEENKDRLCLDKDVLLRKKLNNKRMYDICVGSTKYIGEKRWYHGDIWEAEYGKCGRYWALGNEDSTVNPDFWGPSGYTKLIIDMQNGELTVEYKRSADNHPYTNIPPDIAVGDVVQSFMI